MEPKQTHTMGNGKVKYIVVEKRLLEGILEEVKMLKKMVAAERQDGGEGSWG